MSIDVAHPPRRPDDVESDLQQAWTAVRNSASLRVIKVIHGYGSTGKGGSTRAIVRNWAFANRRHFREVIEGENVAVTESPTDTLLKEVGDWADPDLSRTNPGITLIWVR